MTTNQFYEYLKAKHSDTYGPTRLESTKNLLQSNGLIPKYSERLKRGEAALFIVTAVLAPTFRLSRDGKEFLHVLDQIKNSKENNVLSMMVYLLSDVSWLRTIDDVVIDLSTGNAMIYFSSGKKELIKTLGFSPSRHGPRSFCIIDREHILDLVYRLEQNEDEGHRVEDLENVLKIKQKQHVE